jgi:hypothetical protein
MCACGRQSHEDQAHWLPGMGKIAVPSPATPA